MKKDLLNKVLIIQAHLDDAVLMAGGFLSQFGGKKTIYSACSCDHPALSSKKQTQYLKEYMEFCKKIDTEQKLSMYTSGANLTNKLETVKLTDHISELEELINTFKPQILITHAADQNQDHRRLFDAVHVAVRPHDKNHFISTILLAEQPCTIHSFNNSFNPNVFVPIDIKKKIALYKIFKTQVRDYRGTETITALAKLRGSQCNSPTGYAEAFEAKRIML